MRLLLGVLILGIAAVPLWAAPVLDGTRDASYSTRAVQTVETGFGDNFSELNAAYAEIDGGTLYLMLTGNLESNFNKLNVFIDSVAGGQNQIGPATDEGGTNPNNDDWAENYSGVGPSASGNGPGFKFDAGFAADYLIILRNGFSAALASTSTMPSLAVVQAGLKRPRTCSVVRSRVRTLALCRAPASALRLTTAT